METEKEIKEINTTIRRGILDSRKRQLILNPLFIQFEDKNLVEDLFTRFEKNEIISFRFGINWITGYMFTIGREYQIFIQNKNKKIIKINFKSLYGIRRSELHKLYVGIIDALWGFYFNDVVITLLEKFHNGENIEIGQVHISQEGITIKAAGIFSEKKKTIVWDRVGTASYQTYFNIHSTEDLTNISRGYSFLNDWNTNVLYSVVRTILRDKNLLET